MTIAKRYCDQSIKAIIKAPMSQLVKKNCSLQIVCINIFQLFRQV